MRVVKRNPILFLSSPTISGDALGFAGNPIIKTPNMDKLAGSGLYFKNAFVTTAICTDSRASLFTGLYERTHNYTFGQPPLNNQNMFESYPYLLRKAEYKTGFVGKFGVKVNEGIRDSLFDWSKETAWPYIQIIVIHVSFFKF